MNITLREMRRSWGRFVLLAGSVTLLAFLILFQQAIQDGLITAFIGAIRNQNAPVLVYSLEGQRTPQASFLSPQQVKDISSVPGVGITARVQQSTYSVKVAGSDVDDASVIGTADPRLFFPRQLSQGRSPSAPDEAIGSSDFNLGDVVEIIPSPRGTPMSVKVVGIAENVRLYVTATLFTDIDTSTRIAQAYNPNTPAGLTNVVALIPDKGLDADELTESINSSVDDVDALTREQAAATAPGVAQVVQSFQVIFLLYALVVPLVTGLFFLILTLQKAQALTLLRAMGAQPSFLARSLLIQAAVVLIAGISIAVLLFLPLSQGGLGGLLSFNGRTVATWSAVLMTLGLASTAASLRMVLRIDPIKATAPGIEI
ncbi:MAG: hypothetical protein KDB26_00045 [Microthrixaceae bacterium]|nr:hypothetical protein [Microthrixaceae bacterium]